MGRLKKGEVLSEAAEAEGATLALVLQSMSPWPPSQDSVVGRFQTPVGQITLYVTPAPKLRAIVNSHAGQIAQVTTGKFIIEPDCNFKIALRCTIDLKFTIYADGKLIGHSDDITIENTIFKIQPARISVTLGDLEERSAAAKIKRTDALKSRAPRLGRTSMPASYAEVGLRREVAQVTDLIDACQNGALHHVYGLAARLRLLVAHGRNAHPLLQLVATSTGAALPVYALLSASEIEPTASMVGDWSLRDKPGPDTATLDLDVWLDQPGAAVEGRGYSNNAIIRAIADTVGSHFDPDLEPLVGMLDRIQSGTERGVFSELERWVINTSICVKQLAERTLNDLPINRA